MVQTIRAVNEAVKGALSITKTGEDGQGLAGATFEIKAYKENDLDEPVTTNMIYGTEPVITVQDLPVGEMRQMEASFHIHTRYRRSQRQRVIV